MATLRRSWDYCEGYEGVSATHVLIGVAVGLVVFFALLGIIVVCVRKGYFQSLNKWCTNDKSCVCCAVGSSRDGRGNYANP